MTSWGIYAETTQFFYHVNRPFVHVDNTPERVTIFSIQPLFYNPQNEMFPPRKTKCSKSKTKCLRFRHPPKPYKNSVRTAFLPNSNAISISTYQCLSYHNIKGLHISELQAAIFRCLEQLLLVNCLDGYLYLLVGKFLEILLGLLLLIEEVLIDLSELG